MVKKKFYFADKHFCLCRQREEGLLEIKIVLWTSYIDGPSSNKRASERLGLAFLLPPSCNPIFKVHSPSQSLHHAALGFGEFYLIEFSEASKGRFRIGHGIEKNPPLIVYLNDAEA